MDAQDDHKAAAADDATAVASEAEAETTPVADTTAAVVDAQTDNAPTKQEGDAEEKQPATETTTETATTATTSETTSDAPKLDELFVSRLSWSTRELDLARFIETVAPVFVAKHAAPAQQTNRTQKR